ncbi:protein of unknown function [Methylocaldum szegediense]|uniref:Uncharacterized protein n=1 Tax=Methylocaldum szegediense TaxID=73780 RepID=A0ABN8X8L2_9GAMM|nr:protein of unknown function [Methylocaldum szegediense]
MRSSLWRSSAHALALVRTGTLDIILSAGLSTPNLFTLDASRIETFIISGTCGGSYYNGPARVKALGQHRAAGDIPRSDLRRIANAARH